MRDFTALYRQLDETTKTNEKVAALVEYFQTAPPGRAAYALTFLTGNRVKRSVNTRLLREWAAEMANVPLWLVEESYHHVGDLAETLALILPDPLRPTEYTLDRLVDELLLPLPTLSEEGKKESIQKTWEELVPEQRFIFHKLLGGGFRVGVSKNLVTRALGQVSGLDPAVIAHRMMGEWTPSEETYRRIVEEGEAAHEVGRPYPFCLAYPLEQSPSDLGPIEDWQAEWKWDGIRAQLIRRKGETILWSRGEEMLTERFPDIVEPSTLIPDGTVLDGEVLCWREGKPLPFSQLQKRIGRKRVGKKILEDAPAAFMAYDLLEWKGADVRSEPLSQRRIHLEQLAEDWNSSFPFIFSRTVHVETWEHLETLREESRERGVEGMMLKRLSSPYRVGRRRGDWWKWKIEPLHIDAVLLYAQSGHGRRSNLFTDYTFGLWKETELVPVAKAYSGLTDQEIQEVDRFVRKNTLDRFGPVRVVEPSQVFELAFENVQRSTRHKSGLAVRFPRIHRWRKDKKPEEANRLEDLAALIPDR